MRAQYPMVCHGTPWEPVVTWGSVSEGSLVGTFYRRGEEHLYILVFTVKYLKV